MDKINIKSIQKSGGHILFAAFGFFVLSFISFGVSAANASCHDSFQVMRAPDGAMLYAAVNSYNGLDAVTALDRYRSIAADAGYLIVQEPTHGSESSSMGIGKPSSPNPMLILVVDKDSSAPTVSLTTIVSPGSKGDSSEIKSQVCSLVSKFESDRSDAVMQGGSVDARRDERDVSRTTVPVNAPTLQLLVPSEPFDISSTKAALEPGQSVIRGKACAHYNGTMVLGSGIDVALYPVTPYFEQLIDLEKKVRPGKNRLVADPGAISTRMVAKTNGAGEFQFSRMKPGRYFLVTSISATLGGTRDVYAGSVSNGYASANVYRQEGFSFDAENMLTEFVNIRNDGDSVKVTLQPPVSGNPFRRGMGGSILGCRQLP